MSKPEQTVLPMWVAQEAGIFRTGYGCPAGYLAVTPHAPAQAEIERLTSEREAALADARRLRTALKATELALSRSAFAHEVLAKDSLVREMIHAALAATVETRA